MFAPSRRAASLVYLASMAGTLFCVFVLRLGAVALLCILIQSGALAWYTLSYVPYGQAMAKRLLRRLLKRAGFSGLLERSHDGSGGGGGGSDGGARVSMSELMRPASETGTGDSAV